LESSRASLRSMRELKARRSEDSGAARGGVMGRCILSSRLFLTFSTSCCDLAHASQPDHGSHGSRPHRTPRTELGLTQTTLSSPSKANTPASSSAPSSPSPRQSPHAHATA
jgi:hypothetical protein